VKEVFFKTLTAPESSLESLGENLSSLLSKAVKLNVLCENEARYYFEAPECLSLSEGELFELAKQRAIHHRAEERLIKSGEGSMGGFVRLANGTRIQGSAHAGGFQPDYIVDSLSGPIQEVLRKAREGDDQSLDDWARVERVGALVRSVLGRTEYGDGEYRELMERHRKSGLEVPLSEYVLIGKGVCRESAMLTCLCLDAIGLEACYYYASVEGRTGGASTIEDHAVCVVEIDGENRTVDNYFWAYHGHALADLCDPGGVECKMGLRHDEPEGSGLARVAESKRYPEARHHPKARF
jgi:hypothetical protein